MTNPKRIAETAVNYTSAVTDLSHPLIIERNGSPIAVLVPYDEYQRLRTIEATTAQHQAQAWQQLENLLAEIHSRPALWEADQIEAEITAARAEVGAHHRAHYRRH